MDGSWKYYAKWDKSDGKGQEPYAFTQMWDVKQKATIEQTKQTHRHRHSLVVSKAEGARRTTRRVKGVKYTEGDEVWVLSTQRRTRMSYYSSARLKLTNVPNYCYPHKFNCLKITLMSSSLRLGCPVLDHTGIELSSRDSQL